MTTRNTDTDGSSNKNPLQKLVLTDGKKKGDWPNLFLIHEQRWENYLQQKIEQQNLFLSLASQASMFDFFWTFLAIFKSISEAQLKHLICKFEVFGKKKCSWQKGYKKAKMVRTSGEYLNNGAVLWVFVNVADTFIQSPADYASIYHQQRQTRIHSLLQTQARESKHQTATLELFVFAGLKQLSYPSIWFEFGDYFTTHCSVYCNRIKTFKYDRRNCVILCAASNKRHTHTC